MNLVTIDFESFYSSKYSLSKLSPLQYVMGDEWQTISCSIKIDSGPTDVFFGHDDVAHAFRGIRRYISGGMMIAHNMSGFDAYVAAYRYGLKPKMWGCTMAMARPLHAKTVGLSLAKLVQHYAAELDALGVPSVKDNSVLVQTRGKRLEEFTPAELRDMTTYNRNDTNQCWGLFKILSRHYKAAELWQIDAVTRMRTEPAFKLNVPMLETAASMERSRKHAALLALARQLKNPVGFEPEPAYDGAGGPDWVQDTMADLDWGDEGAVTDFVRGELASAPKFSALLERLGVQVPMKESPTSPGKLIPALAKTDQGMEDLAEHDDPLVAAAARARLDVKSTLLETRIQKFLTAGSLAGGFLPVPIKYCGADTSGRDSGEEYNCQNLPRIIPDTPRVSDALRNCLEAPKGKLVIVADQSGIELRVNHFLWKVASSMALYQASPDKADLYRDFAGRSLWKIEPSEVSKLQRQVGKVSQLGLGFGAGAVTFQRVAWTQGRVRIPLDDSERRSDEPTCQEIMTAWRSTYSEIAAGWKECGRALMRIEQGIESAVDPWGLVSTCREGFVLPSGRLIRYPDLRVESDGEWPDGREKRSWFYAHGRHKARLTGPKADENIVQALARDSIFDCALEFFRRTSLRPALRVHDELVYVVDEAAAPNLLGELQSILRTPPKWWPELIVWSEGDAATSYGKAK